MSKYAQAEPVSNYFIVCTTMVAHMKKLGTNELLISEEEISATRGYTLRVKFGEGGKGLIAIIEKESAENPLDFTP